MKTGDDYDVAYRLRHHDGTYRWVLVRALPVRDTTTRSSAGMGTCHDIHDQKKVPSDLALAVQARDEFLSIASHELKNAADVVEPAIAAHRREIARGKASVYARRTSISW